MYLKPSNSDTENGILKNSKMSPEKKFICSENTLLKDTRITRFIGIDYLNYEKNIYINIKYFISKRPDS